ncbi:unnamed protein product [Colias eurytheme]|nr:unnamed protein product [Colias eurytheme]
MAQLISVRLNKSDQQPLGFRLQGGKDFGTPLVVQKVNGGSAAERAGLQAGDALIRVNNTEVYALRHQEAQDAIRAAGPMLELTVQRGGGTWKPSVTPTGSLPRPGTRPLGANPTPVTNTSLKANQQTSRAFGSGHNNVAKPFGYMNGTDSVKGIVNKQYNTPVNMYSDKTIAETLSAQTEVLAGGVLGVNFKKNEKTYDAEKSAVFKVLQEEQNDPEPEASNTFYSRASVTRAGAPGGVARPPARAVRPSAVPARLAPEPPHRPSIPVGCHQVLPDGRIALGAPAHPQPLPDDLPVVHDPPYCSECNAQIVGVFVRIKDKNLHVECFKCSTCGTSLKNQGYYNINGKLYCDIHAKLVARQNPPAANMEPVTVPPGGRIPTNTYTTPLPPLSTGNYTNGSSSLFSPSSNLSGPKPFGSSIGSAYSPSLSPRSAPLSPARPVAAPAPAPAPPAPLSAPFAPKAPVSMFKAKNVKSIVWPPPNPPEDETPLANSSENVSNKHLAETTFVSTESMSTKATAESKVAKEQLSSDENISRGSPPRSRPSTPSLINKPAPIIPHYQMNLATVEHYAPESHIYQPSGGEGSRTPTPKPRPRTPSQGPTFKAQAPRIKDNAPQSYLNQNQPFSHQLPSTFQQEQNLTQTNMLSNETKHPLLKEEQRSNIERQSENYKEGNMSVKKDSMMNQNYGQRQMETQNVAEYGNTTVQTTRKTFEEYEQIQSAKMIEIKKGASLSSDSYQPVEALIRPSAINSKKSSSAMSFTPTTPSFSSNLTNENVDTTRQTHKTAFEMSPSISGANRGPVCDPPPSTGSSVGAAARGKTFGVSSAPKRGRGVLNKAVLPGSRVPLCASCNGNIRGPFITALGRIWCPEHFICVNATCRRPLQDIGFVEENGQLYCEFCFEQYIAPSCDKCHAKIKGDCLNAIGKHFHPECFSCVYCGKLFGNNPFFLEDGLPYCEADWNELFTTKCFACGFPVEAGDRWVEALNNNYHSQCFNCTVCKKNLEGQSFFAKGGRPFFSLSPPKPSANTSPPQRTRKLETPLHFDGGLFSDIRSTDGKLLSKVTVDHIHSTTKHDVTDSPNLSETFEPEGHKAVIDDIIKTETIINEDVIKVKFTPVPPEIDSISRLSPFLKNRSLTPINYIRNDYDDLTSYQIVNSLCKEMHLLHPADGKIIESESNQSEANSIQREHSPLANTEIPIKLINIDSYLEESLNRLSETKDNTCMENLEEERETVIKDASIRLSQEKILEEANTIVTKDKKEDQAEDVWRSSCTTYSVSAEDAFKIKSKLNSVEQINPGVISAIYNLPMHYHAAILCLFLIVYNLVYQYIKQNCHGNKNNATM